MARHFVSQNDLSPYEIRAIFEATSDLKRQPIQDDMRGRSLVMFFEKTSTRTRLSFEIGMTQLGGHAVFLDKESSQLSRGESLRDTAEVVSRYADVLMARVYSHETVQELARWATIPVINGLSDAEHPCQTLADLYTIQEHKGRLNDLRIVYVGDGANNVAHSLLLGGTLFGAHVTVASPPALQPQPTYVDSARRNAQRYGGSVTITADATSAAQDADVIYTDVWVSMGQEAERGRRLSLLRPYQINPALTAAANGDFIFMHCLPAHIDEEVTGEVAYGPHSVIFDQAENRLHVQKALVLFLIRGIQKEEGE